MGRHEDITALVFDRGEQGEATGAQVRAAQAEPSTVSEAVPECHSPNGACSISARARTIPACLNSIPRNAGERSEIPPDCLRRIQGAESERPKREAGGAVLRHSRRKAKCSELKRTESGAGFPAVAVCACWRLHQAAQSATAPVSRLSRVGNGVKWSHRGRSPGARNEAEWTRRLRSSSQAPTRQPVRRWCA